MSGEAWKELVAEEIWDLVAWLISRGHSQERAIQIAGNHPEATRAEMEAAKAAESAEEVPPAEDHSDDTPAA